MGGRWRSRLFRCLVDDGDKSAGADGASQVIIKTAKQPPFWSLPDVYAEGIAVRLNRVGWNKRSGSTKWERDIPKVRAAIDAHFAHRLSACCCRVRFFSPVLAARFFLQGFGSLSAIMNTEAIC